MYLVHLYSRVCPYLHVPLLPPHPGFPVLPAHGVLLKPGVPLFPPLLGVFLHLGVFQVNLVVSLVPLLLGVFPHSVVTVVPPHPGLHPGVPLVPHHFCKSLLAPPMGVPLVPPMSGIPLHPGLFLVLAHLAVV